VAIHVKETTEKAEQLSTTGVPTSESLLDWRTTIISAEIDEIPADTKVLRLADGEVSGRPEYR
jgi:hypothetical protein